MFCPTNNYVGPKFVHIILAREKERGGGGGGGERERSRYVSK